MHPYNLHRQLAPVSIFSSFLSYHFKMEFHGQTFKVSENQAAASALTILATWVGWMTLSAPKTTRILGLVIEIVNNYLTYIRDS